jgi:hypothetical protein
MDNNPKTTRPLTPEEKVKRLETRVRNLRGELNYLKIWYERELRNNGGMNLEAYRKIVKCLHPDYTPTLAERAEAHGLFTGWKKDWTMASRK